jgi:hypothetical protein
MYDTSIELPLKCLNTAIYGMVSVTEASRGAEPGHFAVEVDLGVNFNTQPVVQLTQKLIHDELGNVYDSGKHVFRYRWIDAEHFSKFEIMLESSVINYPPSIAYLVTGKLGLFQRIFYCLSH